MVALHALVSLVRAAEVDSCGQLNYYLGNSASNINDDDTEGSQTDDNNLPGNEKGTINSDVNGNLSGAVRTARAVLAEEGVLVALLRACERFNDDAHVVAASCMLMRVGVTYALQVDISHCRSSQVFFTHTVVVDAIIQSYTYCWGIF